MPPPTAPVDAQASCGACHQRLEGFADPAQECRVWLAEAYAVWLLAREYDQGRWPYTREEMAWIVATHFLQAISGRSHRERRNGHNGGSHA